MLRGCVCDVRNLKNGVAILKDTNNATDKVNRFDYNCGGFALGTFDWYLPYKEDDDDNYEWIDNEDNMDIVYAARQDFYDGEISYYEMCNIAANVYIDNMIKDGVIEREIKDLSELKNGERLVLFRASETDFHYVRKLSDNTYAHKPGMSNICEMNEDELWSETWSKDRHDPYSGEVRFLAVKERIVCV